MLKLGRVNKFKMLFLVLVFVFNFDVSKFPAAILEKGLLQHSSLSEIVSLDKAHKAVIKSVLAGHTVAMVTCCDTEMITCLPLIGQFIDTTIVALIKVIPWFYIAHSYCARFLRHQRAHMSARAYKT